MASDETAERVLRELRAEELTIRNAIGIPPEFRPVSTLYNATADAVVASVEHYSRKRFERRLFFRRTSERAYRPVVSPPPEIHYDDVVSSPTQPAA